MSSSDDALRRWENYRERIDELFDELIETPWGRREPESAHPPVDIHETENAFILTADLPEVALEDVHVTVRRRQVTICGERRGRQITVWQRDVLSERFVGRFCRRFELPEDVDLDRIEKQTRGGVLRIVMPKKTSEGK